MKAKLSVELLDHMGDDLAVANAARVSMAKESSWECCVGIRECQCDTTAGYLYEADQKLISYLATHHHWTPFSHTAVKLRIKAPIFLARQFFKHKVGFTENEVSRRYVSAAPEFYMPDGWRTAAANVKQGSSPYTIKYLYGSYGEDTKIDHLYEDHLMRSYKLYMNMIEGGICSEQARMVLPQSTMTEWIWTGNVASFARVVKQRLDGHAQVEAQMLAQLMNDLIEPLFPVSWKALTSHG